MIRIHRNKAFQYITMLSAVSFFIVIPNWERKITDVPKPKFFSGDTISCNVITGNSLYSKEYTLGYLYEIFDEFEDDQNVVIKLFPQKSSTEQWQMLNKGDIDMLIINSHKDSVPEEYQQNLISSVPIHKDDIICVAKKEDYNLVQTINYWISSFKHSEEYAPISTKFFKNYRLFGKKASKSSISPYDQIIKEAASKIGWDWKLLSALIYQESRFKAGVSSSQGAIGLMQIKESIARQFGIDNIYEPQDNIRAGTAYLNKLIRIYKRKGADSTNTVKLVLAAYNSGDGRIEDCMYIAKTEKLNPLIWDNIVSIMPLMNKEEYYSMPMVKFGKFKGKETVRFVDNVLKRYKEYQTSVK